ncbi:MAG: hypothetical protein WCF85_16440 [Rhodospirillaceae bacterium]
MVGLPGLAGTTAALVVAASFTLIGSAVPGQTGRPAGADAMIGFGLSTGFLTVAAFGLPSVVGETVLFAWTDTGLRRIASWPIGKPGGIRRVWPIGIQ